MDWLDLVKIVRWSGHWKEEGKMIHRTVKLTLLFLLVLNMSVFAQESQTVPNESGVPRLEPRRLVDCPTAGLLPRASFDFDIRVFPLGGVIFGLDIGLMKRFMVGMSFGGENVIGEGDADWNPRIEFAAKYRMINESWSLPAVVIGFDSQGDGAYDDSLDRYDYKSKGFYGVISKGYAMGDIPFGLHAGVNYSLENVDKDKDFSLFFGADFRFGDNLGVVGEYDLGSNDDKAEELFGQGYGYFNIGVQWIFSEKLLLQFNFKNLLLNRKDVSTWGRGFRMVYFESF
jgi:outer membrane receptor protein involved in Fe transport